jgi:putative chitinase
MGNSTVGTFSRLTVEQLRACMPNLGPARAAQVLPYLNEAMVEADICTPLRQAAFLAQLAHESGELRYMEELASGEAYEGRKDLGNTQPGDGPRYKGRGPIQLTGRNNYRRAGQALGVALEEHPELAAHLHTAFRVAGWYWQSHGLNAFADVGAMHRITRLINGGLNGISYRLAYYERALAALTTE